MYNGIFAFDLLRDDATTADPTALWTTKNHEPLPSTDFHYHGDPVLEAVVKHDNDVDQTARCKALKDIYDEHARMVGHERSGAVLGDHTIWSFQDCLPE